MTALRPPDTGTRAGTRSHAATVTHPRMRARRIEVRRDTARRRLRVLFWVLLVAAFVVWGLVSVRSPLLDVDRVQVGGTERTSAAAVRAALGTQRGAPLIEVDPGAAEARIAALPWVRTAQVQRLWPGTVRVVVTERTPVAQIRGAEAWTLVDADARVLGTSPRPTAGVVVLAGPTPGPAGTTLAGRWRRPLALAERLPDTLAARAASLTEDGGEVTLALRTGALVLVGDMAELDEKVLSLATLLETDQTDVCRLDVRVPAAPTLTRGEACA